jgi:hypothetical protein
MAVERRRDRIMGTVYKIIPFFVFDLFLWLESFMVVACHLAPYLNYINCPRNSLNSLSGKSLIENAT